jgi:anti-sigma factor RsiW
MSRHLGERLSALIDGELSHAQRERVLAHLARCDGCRREATALRLLKRRMYTLGSEAADDALTWRLLALASADGHGPPGRRAWWGHWPGRAGRASRPVRGGRRHARSLVAAAVATVGVGLSAAAFLAGGDRPPPGPRVVPAVDVFMVQHAITTGEVPVQPSGVPSPSLSPAVP